MTLPSSPARRTGPPEDPSRRGGGLTRALPEEPPGLLARAANSPLVRFLVLTGQLAAVLWMIRWYRLEGLVFDKLAILLLGGFAVHYFLLTRARLPFFGLLSGAGILWILGPSQGAWLLALGLAVIGLCHLPIPFGARLGILLAVGVLLCMMRAGRVPVPWSAAIWPLFGSMFTLRIIIYLYDLKHRTAPFSFWRSAAYFFMLPNACFPLFPVVDYQTFCRTYDNDKDRTRVFQTGIDWMVRGALHLVLYRLVYQNLPIETSSVVDVTQLLRYLIWPFLLYLHVSGLFHLVIGMLHLFGFNLPETHHLFYLASSFTDFWRRINIYWKDFMMKVFYYPAFFSLRKLGNNFALVAGTFVVFFATWFLHSWQFFWLRGSFLLKGSDVLFWTILAVLVAGNVLIEANRPMKRRLGSGTPPWRESLGKAFRALGVFLSICLLWSLWVSDSLTEWLSLFSVLRNAQRADLRLVPVVLGFAAVFILVALYYERRKPRPFGFYRHAFQSGAVLCLLFLGAWPWPGDYKRLGDGVARVLTPLKRGTLNTRDAARRQRDYYEKLNDIGWDNPELAKMYMVKPADWGAIRFRPDLVRLKPGLPNFELLPNARGRFRGVDVQFNRWGMNDRDYSLEPGPDTHRIALMGASIVFASGVPREDSFESLVEERLNREGRLGPYRRVEILNFAQEGNTALDIFTLSEKKAFAFKPNALLYIVHPVDAHRAIKQLSELMHERSPFLPPELVRMARSVGVEPGMDPMVGIRKLQPLRQAVLAWEYRQLVDRCRSRGVVPIMAYLPILTPQDHEIPADRMLAIIRDSGFLTFDLSGVYAGREPEKFQVAPWDDHPNVEGHRRVADRLYAAIRGAEASLWRKDEQGRDQGAGAGVHPQGVPRGGGP